MDSVKYVEELSRGVRPYMRPIVRSAAAVGASFITILPENFTIVLSKPDEADMCTFAMRGLLRQLRVQQTDHAITREEFPNGGSVEYTVIQPVQIPVGRRRRPHSFVAGTVALDYRNHGVDNGYHGRALSGEVRFQHPSQADVALIVTFGPTAAFYSDDYSFCVDSLMGDLGMRYSPEYSERIEAFGRALDRVLTH